MKICIKALLVCLMATLLLCGCALAEEEGDFLQAEMPLFSAGEIPTPARRRSTVPEGFAEYIAEQLRAQAEKIKVLDFAMQPADFVLALSNVVNDHPDLFYIGASVRYTTGATSGNVYNYYPEYLYTGEDLQARISAFEGTVSEIAAYARSASSDPIGQMLAVNSYFCIHYSYDDSLSIHSPDQLFTGGTGVCQAYMLGYAAVLDELGIPNTHATSYSMKHVWNLVELDGQWYHIDVTWNDPSGYPLTARYRYFLLSDDGMRAASHYGWTAAYAAGETSYDDFFWQDTFSPMGVSGSSVYYMNDDFTGGTRTICRWNIGESQGTAIHSFNIADAGGSYISSPSYNPLCADDEYIYYAARGDMYRMKPDGSDAEKIRAGKDSAYIFSCWKEGEEIRLLAGSTSMGNTREIAFRLDGVLTLPSGLSEIKAEAFAGAIAKEICLPEGLAGIGERAFAENALLEEINIPASVSYIAENAFEGCANVCLKVHPGSYGEDYAIKNGIAHTY